MSVQLAGEGGKGVEERARKGRRMERKGEGGLGKIERGTLCEHAVEK